MGTTVGLIAALVYAVDDHPDAVEWWPLLLGGVGITLILNFVFEATHDGRLIWVAGLCLLAAGVDTSLASSSGGGLLHSAAAGGLDEILKTLTEGGAAVDEGDNTGATALHFASRNGHRSSVELLLDAHEATRKVIDVDDFAPAVPLAAVADQAA